MTIDELEGKLGSLSAVYRELVKTANDASKYSHAFMEAQKNGASEIDAERYALQSLNGEIKTYNTSSDIVAKQTEKAATATESLRSKMAKAREAVASLTYEYNNLSKSEKNSEFGKDLKRRLDAAVESAGAMKDAMVDANNAMKNAASDTRGLDQLTSAVNVVSSSFTGLTVICDQLGLEFMKDTELGKGLKIAMAALSVATSIQNSLQKESALMQGKNAVMTGINTAKTTALAVATTGHALSMRLAGNAMKMFGIETTSATAATTAFGVALDAVGIGIILTLIALVVEQLKVCWTAITEGTDKLNEFEKVIWDVVSHTNLLVIGVKALYDAFNDESAITEQVDDANKSLSSSIESLNTKYREKVGLLKAIKSAGDAEIRTTGKVTDEYKALVREGIIPANMAYDDYFAHRKEITERIAQIQYHELEAEKDLAQAKARYTAAAFKQTGKFISADITSDQLLAEADKYMAAYNQHMGIVSQQKSALSTIGGSVNKPGNKSGGTSNSTNNEDPAVAKRKKEFEQEQLNIRERNLTNKEQGDKELIAAEERYWRDLLVIAKRGSKDYDDAVEKVYGINAKHKKSIISSIQEEFANQIDENATDEDGNIVMGSPISGNQLGGGTDTPVFSTTGLPQSATKSTKHKYTEEELKARYEAAKKAANDVNDIASGFSSSVDNASQTMENLGIKKSKGALKAMAAVRASETIANGIAGIIAYNRSVDTHNELSPFVQTAMKIANATAATTQMLSAVSAIKAAGEGSTTSSWRPNASSVSQASSQIATFSTQAEDSTSRLEAAIKGQDKSVLVVEDANKANATVQVSQNNATLK